MRLATRLLIAALALATGGTVAGCSAVPGLAYAQTVATPAATATPAAGTVQGGASTPVTASVPPSAQGKTAPTAPAGPVLRVVGAPRAVHAKAGMLVDASTGQVLWARHPGTPRPIASITKVMSALVILQAGGLHRKITVPKAAVSYVARYGANAAGLVPGQAFTVGELLHAMLIESAADAAYTLARAYGPGLSAFVAKMNAEAARLGLTHTHFTSPDGLPYPTETATYSTPAELIKLGEIAMRNPTFRSIVRLPSYILPKGHGHSASYWYTTNELIGHYPGAIGIKTGYTDAAGHTLLFEAVRHGRALIGVVLGSPPTGPASGAQDAAKVLNWGFSLKQTPSRTPASLRSRSHTLPPPHIPAPLRPAPARPVRRRITPEA